jgi:hypothetical protein
VDFIRQAAAAHGHFPQTPLAGSWTHGPVTIVHMKEWGCMKPTLVPVLFLGSVLVNCGGFSRYQSAACKQQGAALTARLKALERAAREKLIIGASKDVIIRFFAENTIPVTFVGDEATGTIYTKGCAPTGCGSDAALIGLRVKVDKEGTVISEPVVVSLYTDCL